jgi:hypothetical protein
MYRVYFFTCLIVLVVSAPLSGSNPVDSLKKKPDTDEKFSSLIFGLDYTSFATTDSRLNDTVSQPLYSPYISFYSKSGVFINASFNLTGNSDSTLKRSTYSLNLGTGYEFTLGENITVTPSYTHVFYNTKTMLLNKLYSNYADISAMYDLKNWSSSVSGSYQWGKISDWLMNLKTGYNFTITKLFSKTDVLLIQPSISAQFSDPNYYSKLFSFLNEYIRKRPNAKLGRLVYDIYNIYERSPYIISLRQKLLADKELAYMIRDYMPAGIVLSDVLTSKDKFTLTSATVSLPISYTTGNLTVNVSVSVYRSLHQPIYLKNSWYTYISGGLSYAINW